VNARRPKRADLGEAPLTWNDLQQAGENGRLWGLVIEDDEPCRAGFYGDAFKDIIANPAAYGQLRKREFGGGLRVLQFVKGGQAL
jgi:hypothetical protein